ncbi:hypothetical protein FORC47_2231 [Bacillus cereus]|nr:hypothetical protein FORC47_2231 [Bacillus cereus]
MVIIVKESQNIVALFLFVYNKDDGKKKTKISFTAFEIYKGNFIVQNQ